MLSPKFLNSRKFFNAVRINSNQFYFDIGRQHSSKDQDSNYNINNLNKDEIKSGDKLNSAKPQEDPNSFIKVNKIYGNMTGMDKIDGMAGQTAGIDNIRGEIRPEDGIYIYNGGLNFDTNKKSSQSPYVKKD